MTQEFVTLPREVVEQAIDALYCTDSEEGSPAYNFELKAIEELRAALEQPQGEQELVQKMYVCNSCQFPYADQPPSQCECLGDETYTEAHLCTNLQPNQPQDEQEPVAIPDGCPHIIWFDDSDMRPMMFAGRGARDAALKAFERVSVQWNAHLFVRIQKNSRDDQYPCAPLYTNPQPKRGR